MGVNTSKALSAVSEQEGTVLIVGLGGAGKTTMLHGLNLGEIETVMPRTDDRFNVQTTEYNQLTFAAWGHGARDEDRELWEQYSKNAVGVVFVVDCHDRARVGEAKAAFWRMLDEKNLANTPIVVLANKQDLPNTMGAKELSESLDVASSNRHCYVQSSCAAAGVGVFEAVDQLASMINERAPLDKAPLEEAAVSRCFSDNSLTVTNSLKIEA